jgi:hypothetical protein
MGMFKKLFFIIIATLCMTPLFQNCGQQQRYGNGDPYEDADPRLDIGPDYQTEIPASGQGSLDYSRLCVGSGNISKITFYPTSPDSSLISFTTSDAKERSVKWDNTSTSINLNTTFSSGLSIKSLNIFDSHVTIQIATSRGSNTFEQLSCYLPK